MMNFKEQSSLDLKSNKSRLESVIKSNMSSITDLENGMKTYTNLHISNHDIAIKANFELINDQIKNTRLENNKYALELKNASSELKTESQKCFDLQNEITLQMNNLTIKNKEINQNTIESFNEFTKEFDVIKRKFNEIAEFIKV